MGLYGVPKESKAIMPNPQQPKVCEEKNFTAFKNRDNL